MCQFAAQLKLKISDCKGNSDVCVIRPRAEIPGGCPCVFERIVPLRIFTCSHPNRKPTQNDESVRRDFPKSSSKCQTFITSREPKTEKKVSSHIAVITGFSRKLRRDFLNVV